MLFYESVLNIGTFLPNYELVRSAANGTSIYQYCTKDMTFLKGQQDYISL